MCDILLSSYDVNDSLTKLEIILLGVEGGGVSVVYLKIEPNLHV